MLVYRETDGVCRCKNPRPVFSNQAVSREDDNFELAEKPPVPQ